MASMAAWWMVGCAWLGLAFGLGCGVDDSADDGGGGPTTGEGTTTGSASSTDGSSSEDGSSSAAVESTGAVDTSDGSSTAAESSSEGPVAEVGQCCFIDSYCTEVTELECTEAEGHSWYAGELCGICPDERIGACCSDDGGCTDGLTVDKCGANHAGPGTTCASGACR